MNLLSFILGCPIKPELQLATFSVDEADQELLKAYYEAHLAPMEMHYETQRVTCLKTARKRLYLSLIVVLGLVLLTVIGYRHGLMLFPFPLLALVGLGFWSFTPTRHFKLQIQQEIYPIMFKYFGDNFIYNRDMCLDINQLAAAKVLPNYDNANFGDYIQGQYKGVDLIVNELTLTKKVRVEEWDGNKRRTTSRTETRFRGTVVELSSHKTFVGHTVVLKDRGGVANFLSDSHSGLQRVKLEDPLFEKEFDVFSTDQIESRYLLNTIFMERLQQLAKYFDGNLQCAFFRNRLFILLSNHRNRFQTRSIFDAANFLAEFCQLNREMKQIFAIIDVLKLNRYTGL